MTRYIKNIRRDKKELGSIEEVSAQYIPSLYQEEISQIKGILDKMPIACIIHDLEFNVVYWNDIATNIFGYTFEQVHGKNLYKKVFREYSRSRLDFLIDKLETDYGISESVENNRTKENDFIICEWNYTPFYKNEKFIGVICTAQDITERVQDKNLLKEQNHILEMIASGVRLPEVLNSLIKYMEQESKRILGSVLILNPDENKLHVAAGSSLPEDYNKQVDGLEVGLYNGSCGTAAFKKEMVIVRDTSTDENWARYKEVAIHFGFKAVTSIPIFDSKKELLGTFAFYYLQNEIPNSFEFKMIKAASAIAGIAIERDRNQKVIKEKEVLHKLITENINILIAITDLEGKLIYCSSSFENLLGLSQKEIKERLFFDFVYEEDIPIVKEAFKKAIEDKGETVTNIIRLIVPNGSYLWMQGWKKLITRNENKYILAVGLDVTERKATEENQKLLTEELIRQNEYLQQFSYITSHNLRAPISNILGLVNLINLNPENGQDKTILKSLNQAALNLDNIIKDLNSLISIKKGANENKEEILFQDLTKIVLKNLEKEVQLSKAKISTDFSQAPGIYSILSYAQSILSNLLENAIKYRSNKRELVIKIVSYSADNKTYLSICDNGLGIDLERQGSKIFGLYKRFHNHVEGKGLGLHIVKTQIETIGGNIEVESKPDVGTCFKLSFAK